MTQLAPRALLVVMLLLASVVAALRYGSASPRYTAPLAVLTVLRGSG
jgi:hypothetical protein